jgi:hypothetical protein
MFPEECTDQAGESLTFAFHLQQAKWKTVARLVNDTRRSEAIKKLRFNGNIMVNGQPYDDAAATHRSDSGGTDPNEGLYETLDLRSRCAAYHGPEPRSMHSMVPGRGIYPYQVMLVLTSLPLPLCLP